MGPVVTTVGAQILTKRAGKAAGSPSLAGTLRLFASNVQIDLDSVAADFVESSFTGYSRRAVGNDSFDPVTIDSGVSVAPNTGNPFSWLTGSAASVWGWLYVLDTGELLSGETFSAVATLLAGTTFLLAVSLTGEPA